VKWLKYLWAHRTTTFGYLQVALGVCATSTGILSPDILKWVVFGNGMLTAILGHYNNRNMS
jgi:hypothetical protein